jgi:hypothetical protein
MMQIELMLDKINLLLTRTDVNYLEEKLLEERERIFKRAFLALLEEMEEGLKRPTGCPLCRSRMRRNGRKPRILETLLGRLEFVRWRYRCQSLRL